MLTARRFLVVALIVTSSLLISLEGVHADLITKGATDSRCGGDDFTGREFVSSTTDKAGNVFTLECVNRAYFEGKIFVKATGKATSFGRCVFKNGANWINFETDTLNNFSEIEWVNVDPDGFTRDSVQSGIKNNKNDPTDTWLKRVSDFLKLNKLDDPKFNRVYKFPFSPNVQEIDAFELGSLVNLVNLTPDQADLSYLDDGFSPISFLEIDPSMRIPGLSLQSAQQVPEPNIAWLLLVGVLSLLAIRNLRSGLGRGLFSRP
jgi:hypothetical protein